jgi:hypothetical protein
MIIGLLLIGLGILSIALAVLQVSTVGNPFIFTGLIGLAIFLIVSGSGFLIGG